MSWQPIETAPEELDGVEHDAQYHAKLGPVVERTTYIPLAKVWVRYVGNYYPRVVTGIYATEAAARAACTSTDEHVEPWAVK